MLFILEREMWFKYKRIFLKYVEKILWMIRYVRNRDYSLNDASQLGLTVEVDSDQIKI